MITLDVLIRVIVASSPLFFATLGELITQRSGVLNLGVEGIFVASCAVGFISTIITGNPYLGLLIGALLGLIIGLIHGLVSVAFRGIHVLSGLALVMVGYGLASVLGKGYVGVPLRSYFYAGGSWVYLLAIMVASSLTAWYLLFRTKLGTIVRSVGENPYSAYSLGVNVVKVRILTTMVGSAIVGLSGAWYVLGYVHLWTEGTGAGRGWIAIAIVISSAWNPVIALLISLVFGMIEVTMWVFQLPPYKLDVYLLGSIPYLATLAILTLVMATPLRRHFKPPKALGEQFYKEERTI